MKPAAKRRPISCNHPKARPSSRFCRPLALIIFHLPAAHEPKLQLKE